MTFFGSISFKYFVFLESDEVIQRYDVVSLLLIEYRINLASSTLKFHLFVSFQQCVTKTPGIESILTNSSYQCVDHNEIK